MCSAITLNVSLSYADDIASVGKAEHNAECLAFLCREGPKYGYFPSPEKSFYVSKGEDEAVARQAFETLDRHLQSLLKARQEDRSQAIDRDTQPNHDREREGGRGLDR